jgi:hypothetical protein
MALPSDKKAKTLHAAAAGGDSGATGLHVAMP